jgi:uncharacterized protein
MTQPLPEQIDPFRLVRQNRILKGTLELRRMERLAPLLHLTDGVADVEIEFGTDDMGVSCVRGHVKAELHFICQRCMQPMTQAIDAEVALGLVANRNDADKVAAHYEPLIVEEVPTPLLPIIEDELLLLVPIVALHEAGECEALPQLNIAAEPAVQRANPFAVLAKLKPRDGGKN